jgi:histidinol-phosphate/aromatic aminotransferase/cobyric acid decarboxylase-like protein
MITSRRVFLRSVGAGAVAEIAARPLTGLSSAATFKQDDGLVRLDNNENAYGPSKKVLDAIHSSVGCVNRYPLMEPNSLTERIADLHRGKTEQILLGCGSTDILRMAAFAFLGKGKQLIQASPTFEAIKDYARAASSEAISVGSTPTFSHDLDGMPHVPVHQPRWYTLAIRTIPPHHLLLVKIWKILLRNFQCPPLS